MNLDRHSWLSVLALLITASLVFVLALKLRQADHQAWSQGRCAAPAGDAAAAAVGVQAKAAGDATVCAAGPACSELPGLGTPEELMALALPTLPVLLLIPLCQFASRRSVQPLAALGDRIEAMLAVGRAPLIRRAGGNPERLLDLVSAAVGAVERRLRELEARQSSSGTAGKLLAYRKAQFEAVLNALPDAVMTLDPNGSAAFASSKLRLLLGVAAEDTLGKPPREWCPVDAVTGFLARYQDGNEQTQRADSMEYVADPASDRHMTVTAVPLRSSAGELESGGTVVCFRETTHEHLARRARDEFVAHVSHELKSPLQVLKMYSELLQDNPDCDAALRLEAVNAIHDETERMAELIGNLLSISRIETGSISLDRSRVRLSDLLQDVFRNTTATALRTGLQCRISVPDDLPALSLDKGLFSIAMKNLLNNAIKYNRPGGSVTLIAEEDAEHCWIRVRDTGLGVAAVDRERIFEKFYRSAEPEAASRGGHGLGLYLTRQIIELHHAELEFDSTPGEGSEFRVVLRKNPHNMAERI